MKTRFFAVAFLTCAIFLGGCSKDSSEKVTGSYSYKTSGTVTLMATQLVGLDEATLAAYRAMGVNVDPVTLGLYPEQGQMHIIDSEDGVIITFNDLLGNADVAEGKIDGKEVSIEGAPVKTAQLTDGNEKIGAGIVVYGGSGKKYDDMLILNLTYQGGFTVNDIPMTVVGSDIHCVAQHN